ncbi:MAG: DNA-binding protein [Desulfotignum sp.]|nr:DNA-binding protein [Desulfotignum sp.]
MEKTSHDSADTMRENLLKTAARQLENLLTLTRIPRKGSYAPGEVCRILGISSTTLWRKTEKFDLDPNTRRPMYPDALDSYKVGFHKRVTYAELVSYLARNRTYTRNLSE